MDKSCGIFYDWFSEGSDCAAFRILEFNTRLSLAFSVEWYEVLNGAHPCWWIEYRNNRKEVLF